MSVINPPSLGHKQPQGLVVSPADFGAAGNGAYTVGVGSGGSMSGTDDTAAFKNMLSPLASGAATSLTCLLEPKTYYLNGTPDNTYFGNAVVPIPTLGYSKSQLNAISANIPFDKPCLRLIGVPGQTKILCPRTDAYSGTNGPMSVIGTPTVEGLGLTKSPPSLPLRVEMEGITFIGPDQPVGLLVDLGTATSKRTVNCAFFTTTTTNFENSGTSVQNLPGISSAAIRAPIGGSMESRNLMQECIINGYGAGVVVANHVVLIDVVMNYTRTLIAFDDTATSNAPVTCLYVWGSGSNYKVTGWDPATGVKSLTTTADSGIRNIYGNIGLAPWVAPFTDTADFLDANNLIGGQLSTYEWANVLGYGNPQAWTRGRSPRLATKPMDSGVISGTATLVAGTVTVTPPNAANITAASRIRCGILTPGGTPGAAFVNTVTAGTSFQIKSTSSTDTSVVWWEIANPT